VTSGYSRLGIIVIIVWTKPRNSGKKIGIGLKRMVGLLMSIYFAENLSDDNLWVENFVESWSRW